MEKNGPNYVIFLHNNSEPHVDKTTQKAIMDLKWEVFPYHAYSTDLTSSDYHLFRSGEHALRYTTFKSEIRSYGPSKEFYEEKKV